MGFVIFDLDLPLQFGDVRSHKRDVLATIPPAPMALPADVGVAPSDDDAVVLVDVDNEAVRSDLADAGHHNCSDLETEVSQRLEEDATSVTLDENDQGLT